MSIFDRVKKQQEELAKAYRAGLEGLARKMSYEAFLRGALEKACFDPTYCAVREVMKKKKESAILSGSAFHQGRTDAELWLIALRELRDYYEHKNDFFDYLCPLCCVARHLVDMSFLRRPRLHPEENFYCWVCPWRQVDGQYCGETANVLSNRETRPDDWCKKSIARIDRWREYYVTEFFENRKDQKEKTMSKKEFKITKDAILRMAEKCPDAKCVLKEGFPEAFEEDRCINTVVLEDITKRCSLKTIGKSLAIIHDGFAIAYIQTIEITPVGDEDGCRLRDGCLHRRKVK